MGPAMPSRITWLSVRQWCAYYEYTADEADFMDVCIIAMDEEYLTHHAELVKQEMKK